MKPFWALAVLVGLVLGALGIMLNAPPYMAEEVVAILGVAFAVSLAAILRGPLGKAIADSLRGGEGEGGEPEWVGRLLNQVDDLTDEVRQSRVDQLQLAERIDFTERLLAQRERERERLPDGTERT